MQFSTHHIEEFRVLYAKEFGKIVTEEEAREMATRLINLYLVIYRPLSGEQTAVTTQSAEDPSVPSAAVPNPE